jgi:hypothetical protein
MEKWQWKIRSLRQFLRGWNKNIAGQNKKEKKNSFDNWWFRQKGLNSSALWSGIKLETLPQRTIGSVIKGRRN